MIGVDRQPTDLPPVFIRYLPDDVLQAIMHRPYKDLTPALGTPDEVVHH
jgi:hypothetical protein